MLKQTDNNQDANVHVKVLYRIRQIEVATLVYMIIFVSFLMF